jgi:hypothetical protein
MRAVSELFSNGINDLLSYIDVLKLQEKTVKYLLTMPENIMATKYAEAVKKCNSMRNLEYSCSIITLYGLLERFVEGLLEAYIAEMCLTVNTLISRQNYNYVGSATSSFSIIKR